jgi:hypothetical protein
MRATRILSEIKHLNYEERLKTLNLPTLAHRRHRGDMIQTFKIIKGLKDTPVERFFTIVNSNTRGHMCKLVKPRCNTPFRLQHLHICPRVLELTIVKNLSPGISFNPLIILKVCIMSPLCLRCTKVGKLRVFNLSS